MLSAAVLLAAVGALGWTGVRAVARTTDDRARRRAAVALPGAVADLARSVRTGATLDVALRELAPSTSGVLGAELRTAVVLLDRGHDLDRVLRAWGRASRVGGVDLLVAACRFSIGRSVALERALDGTAATLLDRVEIHDEVTALAAQARTSATVLVALPPVGALLFCLLDPGFARTVLASSPGRLCLLLGLALDAGGAAASRALVRRAVDGGPSRGRPGGPSGGRRR